MICKQFNDRKLENIVVELIWSSITKWIRFDQHADIMLFFSHSLFVFFSHCFLVFVSSLSLSLLFLSSLFILYVRWFTEFPFNIDLIDSCLIKHSIESSPAALFFVFRYFSMKIFFSRSFLLWNNYSIDYIRLVEAPLFTLIAVPRVIRLEWSIDHQTATLPLLFHVKHRHDQSIRRDESITHLNIQ